MSSRKVGLRLLTRPKELEIVSWRVEMGACALVAGEVGYFGFELVANAGVVGSRQYSGFRGWSRCLTRTQRRRAPGRRKSHGKVSRLETATHDQHEAWESPDLQPLYLQWRTAANRRARSTSWGSLVRAQYRPFSLAQPCDSAWLSGARDAIGVVRVIACRTGAGSRFRVGAQLRRAQQMYDAHGNAAIARASSGAHPDEPAGLRWPLTPLRASG